MVIKAIYQNAQLFRPIISQSTLYSPSLSSYDNSPPIKMYILRLIKVGTIYIILYHIQRKIFIYLLSILILSPFVLMGPNLHN